MARLLLTALVAIFFSSIAHAQPRVSEGEFLSLLGDGHPGILALSERIGAARAEWVRASLLPNPVGGFEREAPRDGAEQTTWRIAWRPPLDGRRGAAVRAAKAGLEAATFELEASRLALRSELRQAFAEWALTTERAEVIRSHLRLIESLAEQGRARARSGEESGLAARRLSLAALEVQAEAARTEAAASRGRALALSWHRELPAEARVERPPLPALSDTIRTPLRSDLLARRSEVEQARWQLRLGRRFLEFPELGFGWQEIREQSAGPVLSLSWPLPVFERQQPERIEAAARLAAAEARMELASVRASAELSATRAVYLRLREAALQALQTAGESDRVVESATATFRVGESRLTDLLETLRSVLSARMAALDLYAAALEAHRTLELSAGRPLTDGGSK